ncbi:MAG: hypothetical protein SH809_03885 [Rhodothermales bacterium]|nr:hypothetical protein [Rhodothermales bacterium]
MRFLPILLCVSFLAGIDREAAAQSSPVVMLDSIRTAYQRIDFGAAKTHIEHALDAFDQFSPYQLTDVHTYYAKVLFSENDRSGARRQLMFALQITPEMKLDPLDASPKLLTLFDEVLAEMANTPAAGAAEPAVRYLIVDDPRSSATMRSMVLPGWGQLYKNERRKGALLIGLWSATAGGTLAAAVLRQRAEQRYEDALLPAAIQDRYQTFNTWHVVRNNLFLSAVGVWAFSYVDALLVWKAPSTGLPVAGIQLVPLPGQTRVALSIRF